jgi:hypothetical protein
LKRTIFNLRVNIKERKPFTLNNNIMLTKGQKEKRKVNKTPALKSKREKGYISNRVTTRFIVPRSKERAYYKT